MENKVSNALLPAAAVILAAGYSSRMGDFKPLMPIGEKTAVEMLVDSFLAAGIRRIVVVTGYNRELVKKLLDVLATHASARHAVSGDALTVEHLPDEPVIMEAYNPDFDRGMFTSIQAGIRAVMDICRTDHADAACDGLFLLPVDYPLVRSGHLRLIFEESRRNPSSFITPCYMGKKGHPIWIPAAYWQEIINYQGEGGLKTVTSKYDDSGLLDRLELDDEAVVLDMDTPDGYQDVLDYLGDLGCIGCPNHLKDPESAAKSIGDIAENFKGRILLVRHGRTEQHTEKIFLGQSDVPLSTEGRHDAFMAGQELADMKLNTNVIYTSDLARAAVSAEIIRTTLGLAGEGPGFEIVQVPEFREMNLGDWDGRFISKIKAEFPEEYEKRGRDKLIYKRGHDGENFYDLQYRVMKKLKQLVRAACREGKSGTDIIIVAHRGVIKVIICNLLGYGLEAMETFDVPRGSVTNLDYRQASSDRVCNEDQPDKK